MRTADKLATRVSTKGQVILPKALRERLRWGPGTRLTAEPTEDGVLLRAAVPLFPPTRPEDVFGCAGYSGPPKTLEEMNEGVLAEAKRRHAGDRY
jgi:AbrB family looped-hinge helix DNA binding protein